MLRLLTLSPPLVSLTPLEVTFDRVPYMVHDVVKVLMPFSNNCLTI